MRYSRLCRRLRECRSPVGVAFAFPSIIASVKLRGAKGSYAMLSRATHEAGCGGRTYHHISGAFYRCAQFQNVNVRQIYGMSKRIDTPMAVIVFFFDFLVGDNKISPL